MSRCLTKLKDAVFRLVCRVVLVFVLSSCLDWKRPTAQLSIECPADMVALTRSGVCMDRYEASRGPSGEALSQAGIEPWAGLTQYAASQACRLATKHLCTEEEWLEGCRGPQQRQYPYAVLYSSSDCNGQEQGLGDAQATGHFTMCEGGYPGLFDMSGNVSEWTASCEGDECRTGGGSFGDLETELMCENLQTISKNNTYQTIGFRCCDEPITGRDR